VIHTGFRVIHTEGQHMKAALFAISVIGLLGFTSYRAMTIEPDPPVASNYTNYGGYEIPRTLR